MRWQLGDYCAKNVVGYCNEGLWDAWMYALARAGMGDAAIPCRSHVPPRGPFLRARVYVRQGPNGLDATEEE